MREKLKFRLHKNWDSYSQSASFRFLFLCVWLREWDGALCCVRAFRHTYSYFFVFFGGWWSIKKKSQFSYYYFFNHFHNHHSATHMNKTFILFYLHQKIFKSQSSLIFLIYFVFILTAMYLVLRIHMVQWPSIKATNKSWRKFNTHVKGRVEVFFFLLFFFLLLIPFGDSWCAHVTFWKEKLFVKKAIGEIEEKLPVISLFKFLKAWWFWIFCDRYEKFCCFLNVGREMCLLWFSMNVKSRYFLFV